MDLFDFLEKEVNHRVDLLSSALARGEWRDLGSVNHMTGQVRGLEAALLVIREAKDKYGEE